MAVSRALTAAAVASGPQVVIPQLDDQHYWATRVRDLRIGAAHAPGIPTAESLTVALHDTLESDVAKRARSVAGAEPTDGTRVAAQRLIPPTRRASSCTE